MTALKESHEVATKNSTDRQVGETNTGTLVTTSAGPYSINRCARCV